MPLFLNPGVTTTLLSSAATSDFAVSAIFQVSVSGSVVLTGTQSGAFQNLVYVLQVFDPSTGKYQTITSWDVIATGGTLSSYLVPGNYYQLAATSFASSGGFNSTITATPPVVSTTQTIAAIPTGANVIGKVSIDQTTPGTTNLISIGPASTIASACSIKNAASLTVVNVKASAGNVYGVTIVNKVASVIYLQFYNTAGTPVLGTSVIFWIPVAASATLVIPPDCQALGNFATGIGIGASTTPTSTGTPATAPDVTVWYK